MEKVWLNGNFSDSPFPHLLYRVWNYKKTGHLEIKKDNTSKNIDFYEGDVIANASSLNKMSFFSLLQKEKHLSSSSMKKCEKFAKAKKISQLKTITELNIFSSLELWEFLKRFLIDDVLPLFDWTDADYFFDPAQETDKSEILISIPTLKIIRKGIYQMNDQEIINSHIPSSDKYIQTHANKSFLNTDLKPNEIYLLNIIGDKIKISELYKLSEIGNKETNRLIYLFSCLRIAGPLHKNTISFTKEISKFELSNILNSFNKKCVYIYKYISKEIGPVALSVLEKCIKDIKPHLPLQLQNISLSQNGEVNISSTPSTHPSLPGEIKLDEFLASLNEILVSELLTVKKTLGDEHESKVAKNLKNIGKWNTKKTKSWAF